MSWQCHVQDSGGVAWLSPLLYYLHLLQRGRTAPSLSLQGRVVSALQLREGEAVPDGNWAEVLREKAGLRWRMG